MIDSLVRIFEASLTIWKHAQSTKYQKAVLDLKRKIAKENEKEKPDYSYIDRCERELCWLADLASTEIKGQAFKDLQGQ